MPEITLRLPEALSLVTTLQAGVSLVTVLRENLSPADPGEETFYLLTRAGDILTSRAGDRLTFRSL